MPGHKIGVNMDLVFSNTVFVLDRHCRYPEIPNAYLAFLARCQSRRTLRQSAYYLKDYWDWCERSAVAWDKATEGDIWNYVRTIPGKSEAYNRSIGRVCDFYRYAERNGVANPTENLVRPKNILKRRNRLEPEIRIPSLDAYARFLVGLERERNRLIAETFFVTGLRLDELRALPRSLGAWVPDRNDEVEYTVVGKGDVARTLKMGVEHWRSLVAYAEKASGPYLFSHDGVRPLSSDTIEKVFRRNSHATGVRIYPHLLRHMFATFRLRALLAQGIGTDAALLRVQMELGHRSIHTTSIYLHLIPGGPVSASMGRYQQNMSREIECKIRKLKASRK